MPYADPARQRIAVAEAVARHRDMTARALALTRLLAECQPPIPADEAQRMARAALAPQSGTELRVRSAANPGLGRIP